MLAVTIVAVIGLISPSGAADEEGLVTEFSAGLTPGASPSGITAGPDGNLWFTEANANQIGRITPAGVVTEFSAGITPGAGLSGITAGPDGNLWFTEYDGNRIGRITPKGKVKEFSAGISSPPREITAGCDGNLWFTQDYGNRIGRITPKGKVTEFSAGITPEALPTGITAGPDGNVWFTEGGSFGFGGSTANLGGIGRITRKGKITEFSAGITPQEEYGPYPYRITAGPDGNLWFTEIDGHRIGRITPDGQVTEFSAGLSPMASPQGITAGPDGNVWFTEVDRIGRIGTGTSTAPRARPDRKLPAACPRARRSK